MDKMHWDQLDSNLIDIIIEKIEDKKLDKQGVLEYLGRATRISERTPRTKFRLRGGLKKIIDKAQFEDDRLVLLDDKLSELGGPLKTVASGEVIPISSSVPTDIDNLFQPAGRVQETGVVSPWNAINEEEAHVFLSQINTIDGKYPVDVGSTQVAWSSLPFYENVALLRVNDPLWTNPEMVVYYLSNKETLFRLNGTSPPLHEVNSKATISLSELNVIAYLKFFCFFVRAEEGVFYVVESIDDALRFSELNATTRSVIDSKVSPVTLDGTNEQGHFLCTAFVFYSNALFKSSFAIQPSGMVNMIADEPIAGDLSGKIEAPII